MRTLLIVDDEHSVRISLQAVFDSEYRLLLAENGKTALRLAEEEGPDIVLIDLMMPGMSGLDVIPQLKALDPHVVIVVLSAMNDVESVVKAVRLGAGHYVTKPFDVNEVRLLVQMALKAAEKSVGLSALKTEMTRWYNVDQVVGSSDAWMETLAMVKRAAGSSDTTIMFYGESGTGKELLTRLAHDSSSRSKAPFIPIHCAAIPEALLESELFGHEKGSFTGATELRRGCVEMADHGTLFLDEIGEMPLAMQSKLLRFLQDHQFMRVGGRTIRQADVRVLGATNKDLRKGVEEGWFREDLFYRLNVVPILIPPLRDRKGDVELLVRHFLAHFCKECRAAMKETTPEALALLKDHSWPGNVRELRNLMERIVVLNGDSSALAPEHLPVEVRGGAAPSSVTSPDLSLPTSMDDRVQELETRLIQAALEQSDENLSQAAVLLQTTRRILKYKIDQYNIVA
ncbi:MAG: sigma-54-dependent Fis family transcriptional regulator [Lentisphaerae bacterium]|mgnify:CR=1 FL=1|jgi:two-component system, NtrC family, response regulator AtoC|nr:sigma-54-dependent Fis family transcriptional regulator [Lentisphaerota bacterium]MBT4821279.1 sigma-54-dependent Fis family transcriptional regulator [Lentisphaerota bacterium]MBT5604419.1 sigma-54-dependent Fis family transcriptional regulator [Lentisphaerota bacterium]MBT7058176.1 sigma-54-dependent Fis family transcriptional regulator [Lentisphaerota bacterium]MBT7847440.1 sigma-54-dependent Fis family transcriptional regulator [Lentisphaerota bacterium]